MKHSVSSVFTAFAVTATGLVLQPVAAHAGIFETRCANDSMDPTQAALRLEWARRCGTTVNIMSPANPDTNRRFLTGTTSSTGVALWEYSETDEFWGRNSFSGDNGAYINTVFTQYQFKPFPPGITASNDVNGYQKWTKGALLPRPLYPTFADDHVLETSHALFPHPKFLLGDFSDCRLYKDSAGTVLADTSVTGFYVTGFCTSSCYTPDQAISFEKGDQRILDAFSAARFNGLITVAPGSTLDKIRFRSDEVASYTSDQRDANQVVYVITTASGGELHVTDKHPVIEGSGRVVEAASLKEGDMLIKADGSLDPIVSMYKTNYFGKVYNLKPKSTDHTANILVAQGFLVGSSRYQNEDADYLNRIILGRSLPANVIP